MKAVSIQEWCEERFEKALAMTRETYRMNDGAILLSRDAFNDFAENLCVIFDEADPMNVMSTLHYQCWIKKVYRRVWFA